MKSHSYQLYGLTISSEFECPELPAGIAAPDVVVRVGQDLQNHLATSEHGGVICEEAATVLLKIPRVAHFRITAGHEILIHKHPEADDDLVRVYFQGSVLGIILHQRGLLPLHGNAISTGQGCIAFLGHSGQGKSTLAAAFMQRGYKTLSDDICALHVAADTPPMVLPGIPHIRLWDDSVRQLGKDSSRLKRVHPAEEKFLFPIGEHYLGTAQALTRIFVLATHSSNTFEIETLTAIQRMRIIKAQTYRSSYIAKMGLAQRHFQQCSEVIRQIPLLRIYRPEGVFLIEELVDLIEKEFIAPTPLGGEILP